MSIDSILESRRNDFDGWIVVLIGVLEKFLQQPLMSRPFFQGPDESDAVDISSSQSLFVSNLSKGGSYEGTNIHNEV